MSRIDKLIAEYCPGGVPFCELSEISRTLPGLSGKTKADFSDGNARYVSYKNAFANIAVDQSAQDLVKVGPGEKQNSLQIGDVVITGSSESLDEVGMSSVVDVEPGEPLYLNSFCFIVRFDDASILLPGFSKYLFRADSVRSQIRRTASGVTRINVSKPRFMKIRIPVPPLAVQQEIVRILDQFTQLEAELEAELAARLKQRDALSANFEVSLRDSKSAGVRAATLGELCQEVIEPVAIEPDQSYVSLGVKWNGEGVLVRDTKPGHEIKAKVLYRVCPGQLVYNRMFVVEGSFAVVPEDVVGAVVSGEFPLFDINENKVDPYWLINFLCSRYTLSRIEREVTGTERGTMKSRRRWKSNQFAAFTLQLPPLEEQKRTVRVLRLCDELIGSLRAELAARTKQSAYYRDKLLTFEESVA